ncbi:hypothetical protein SK128_006150 [Halocaridina rubra]|uniref:Metalloendopeptidase n=1 Tax=Halocaridina rubra TaxID=373956 RepID=A0AAN8WXY3_HALRR
MSLIFSSSFCTMRVLHILVVLMELSQVRTMSLYFGQALDSAEAFDEHSSYFEADILAGSVVTKMAVRDNHKLWDGGQVPYKLDFDPTSPDNVYVHDNIMAAIAAINAVGCVSIYEANMETDVVNIRLDVDYSSYVGRQGGVQNLTVSSDNSNIGTIMHELMHTLGFGHEHNRADRDDFIIIQWDNIKDEAKPYFQKYTEESGFTDHDISYDYESLMHATNQKNEDIFIDLNKPIITRLDGSTSVGQRSHLTEKDVERIIAAYSCGICEDAPDNTLFRYPGDCHKYYQCDQHHAVARICSADLHFHVEANYCDYPWLADCTEMS